MGNQALKALSLQYIRGEISKPEYRQQRKQIIDEATSFIKPEPGDANKTPEQRDAQSSPLFKAGLISALVVAMILVLYNVF